MSKKFIINNKKDFILTFPIDCLELTKTLIFQKLSQLAIENEFDILIGEDIGTKNPRTHWHCYIHCRKKHGFYTKRVDFFDIKLSKTVLSFYKKNEDNEEYVAEQKYWDDFNCDFQNVEQYKKDHNYSKYVLVDYAHPNIKFKGRKTIFDIIDYCIKNDQNPLSNFNWRELYKKEEKKITRVSKQEKLDELSDFIRNCFYIGFNENQIMKEIIDNPDYFKTYCNNTNNYKTVIKTYFKKRENKIPTPIYSDYYVPNTLADYLKYLDNFVEKWYEELVFPLNDGKFKNFEEAFKEFVKHNPERPMTLFLSGKAESGKTKLISCYGLATYIKDIFNYDAINEISPFNFFDDYDNYGDDNDKKREWKYIKNFLSCQEICTITGKYREVKDVYNWKPCVFVSNENFEERFNDITKSYLRDRNIIVVDLKNKEKLWLLKDESSNNIPKFATIGGFINYKQINTKDTYFYKNQEKITKRKLENSEDSDNKKQKTNASEISNNESIPILIEDKSCEITLNSDDEEIPRANCFASTSNFTPSNNSFNGNISGLDGSNYSIARKNYLKKVLDICKNKVINSIKKEEDSPLKMITREYYRDIYNLKENSEVIKLVEAVSAEEINSVAKMIEKKFSVIVKEGN